MLARFAAVIVTAFSVAAFAQTPPAGYPADYAQTIAAAKKEGKVVIYSALDTKAAQPLIKDFKALYPGHQGRVQRHELDRDVQPLHRRSRGRARAPPT